MSYEQRSMSADFLVEIGTEELPPKSLLQLSQAFEAGVVSGLNANQLAYTGVTAFASPRRLAVLVAGLAEQAPEQEIVAWGPPAKVAFDADGNPTKAAEAFARKNGIDVAELNSKVENDGKQDKLCHRAVVAGARLADRIETILEEALKALPIAKRMRWGASRQEFVRPMHWLVSLYGDKVLDCSVMGIQGGRTSRGHRIHCGKDIVINRPADYLEQLRSGYVMADFVERRNLIRSQVEAVAQQVGGHAVIGDDLLDEVTALNEWPTALMGKFEERFLEVPAEALISSMKEHQKYFHVVDDNGKLMPLFITICNIESKDPAQVIAGNERVIRPRLADAAFFYETDKKSSLEERREKLKKIVFQAKLGTVYAKTERVAKLAESLADKVGANPAHAFRAAQLCKSDLVSEMVLEFSDLQGLMGRYYAQHDGEHNDVAQAQFEHYLPRFAGDHLPLTTTGTAVALADRIDTLVGIFGIGMTPTGSKDPFALRRASLGVLRLLVENNIDIDLRDLLNTAAEQYADLPKAETVVEQVLTYMTDRFRAMYEEQGITTEVFLSVAAKQLSNPLDIDQRVQAVNSFSQLEEAAALAAANKRVSNILAKSNDEVLPKANPALLELPEEKALLEALDQIAEQTTPLVNNRQYTEALKAKAVLREPVDNFFDKVMVNVEDQAVRQNRLTLLAALRKDFLSVADISLLVPAK